MKYIFTILCTLYSINVSAKTEKILGLNERTQTLHGTKIRYKDLPFLRLMFGDNKQISNIQNSYEAEIKNIAQIEFITGKDVKALLNNLTLSGCDLDNLQFSLNNNDQTLIQLFIDLYEKPIDFNEIKYKDATLSLDGALTSITSLSNNESYEMLNEIIKQNKRLSDILDIIYQDNDPIILLKILSRQQAEKNTTTKNTTTDIQPIIDKLKKLKNIEITHEDLSSDNLSFLTFAKIIQFNKDHRNIYDLIRADSIKNVINKLSDDEKIIFALILVHNDYNRQFYENLYINDPSRFGKDSLESQHLHAKIAEVDLEKIKTERENWYYFVNTIENKITETDNKLTDTNLKKEFKQQKETLLSEISIAFDTMQKNPNAESIDRAISMLKTEEPAIYKMLKYFSEKQSKIDADRKIQIESQKKIAEKLNNQLNILLKDLEENRSTEPIISNGRSNTAHAIECISSYILSIDTDFEKELLNKLNDQALDSIDRYIAAQAELQDIRKKGMAAQQEYEDALKALKNADENADENANLTTERQNIATAAQLFEQKSAEIESLFHQTQSDITNLIKLLESEASEASEEPKIVMTKVIIDKNFNKIII